MTATPTGVYTIPVDDGVIVKWTAVSGAVAYRVYYKLGTSVTTGDSYLSDANNTKLVPSLTEWSDYAFGVTAFDGGAVESSLSTVVVTQPGVVNQHMFGVMINPTNFLYHTFSVRGAWWRQTTGVTLSSATTQATVAAIQAAAAALGITLRMFLTVRWDGGAGSPDTGPIGSSQLSTWSTNLATYASNYLVSGDAVAVLNEEPSATFNSLTATQYKAALEAAYDVLNPLGIIVANGGIVWNGAALCYYAHLLEDVSASAAHTFAHIAFPPGADRTALESATSISGLSSTIQTVISKNRDYLTNVYKATSKYDYMNIHVHWPDTIDGTIDSVRQVFQWYASETGKEVVSNESNIEGTSSSLLVDLMELYMELDCPIAVQYSVDSGDSQALQDPATNSLRTAGEAWRDRVVQLEVERTPANLVVTPGNEFDDTVLDFDPVTGAHSYIAYWEFDSTLTKATADGSQSLPDTDNQPIDLGELSYPTTIGVSALAYGGEGLFLSNAVTDGDTPAISVSPIPGRGRITMSTDYQIWVARDDGTRIQLLDEVGAFEFTRVLNNVGYFKINLPQGISPVVAKTDRRINIWRRTQGGNGKLAFSGLLIDPLSRADKFGNLIRVIQGPDLNDLLRRVYVMFSPGGAYSLLTDQADDMMKTVVNYNRGANATTGNGRKRNASLSTSIFSVEANVGLGPSFTKAIHYQNVLDVLRDISDTARANGTEVYFGVVPTTSAASKFVTRINQWGSDRTTARNKSVFSMEYGNLINPSLEEIYSGEINAATAIDSAGGTYNYDDTTRSGRSLIALREGIVRSDDPDNLASEAKREAIAGRPITRFTGTLLSVDGYRYGLDWDFGDRVPVSFDGKQFPALVRAVTVEVNEGGKEEITATCEGYL